MADRDFNPDDIRLVDLLRQLQALSPEGAETAGRIILRDANGAYVGEALVDSKALEAAAAALQSVNDVHASDIAEAQREALADIDGAPAGPAAPTVDLDPMLQAELEEHFIGLDADHLMAMAASDTNAAVAEFDEITAEDGEL